jgi:hypothetical protein
MRVRRFKRSMIGLLCGLLLALGIGAPAAQGAFDDPLFLMRPEQPKLFPPPPLTPPPTGAFEGVCGIAVDGSGRVYVSDYYHRTVDVFGSGIGPAFPYGYEGQIANVDPLDGPCGLALDVTGNLYVNDFHRDVLKYTPFPSFGPGTSIVAGGPIPEARPTGVAVNRVTGFAYVNDRNVIVGYDPANVANVQVGLGSLEDAYGLAVSEYTTTKGFLYVPDAGNDTVKVFDPAVDLEDPVAVIDGSGTPNGHFTSLRDSAIAVDNASGEIYVVDNLEPFGAELPEAVVYVFAADGTYKGRLKYSLVFGQPNGIAVDNSGTANQSRVYVSTGNTEKDAIYAYPPGAATTNAVLLPGRAPGGPGPSSVASVPGAAAITTSSTPAVAPAAIAVTGEAAAKRKAHQHKKKPAKRRAGHRHARRHHR